MIQNGDAFEERITLWHAASAEAAIAEAEAEAARYVRLWDGAARVLAVFQSYRLAEPPGPGREIFSLIRRSDMKPDEYVHRYFATGAELQTDVD